MSQRLPVIMFVVGVLAGGLTFRLTEFATYRAVLVGACIALTPFAGGGDTPEPA